MVHLDNSGVFSHLKILKINLGIWPCKEMTPDSGDSSLVSLAMLSHLPHRDVYCQFFREMR